MPGLLLLVVLLIGAACQSGPAAPGQARAGESADAAPRARRPWIEERQRPTELRVAGPAPASVSELQLDETMERVRYPSGDLSLLGVLARPARMPRTAETPEEKLPAVLLVHDGHAVTNDTVAAAKLLTSAGIVVLMPSFRGENGNPGAFELWRGEVRDAAAATRFLAREPDVDVDRMYAFGLGDGGAVVALLALHEDMPFSVMATSGGLVVGPADFERRRARDARLLPFAADDLEEQMARAFVPHAHELERRLVVYVPAGDADARRRAELARSRAPDRLDIVELGKDEPALLRFRQRVLAQPGRSPSNAR